LITALHRVLTYLRDSESITVMVASWFGDDRESISRRIQKIARRGMECYIKKRRHQKKVNQCENHAKTEKNYIIEHRRGFR